jgi:hypothetical protein
MSICKQEYRQQEKHHTHERLKMTNKETEHLDILLHTSSPPHNLWVRLPFEKDALRCVITDRLLAPGRAQHTDSDAAWEIADVKYRELATKIPALHDQVEGYIECCALARDWGQPLLQGATEYLTLLNCIAQLYNTIPRNLRDQVTDIYSHISIYNQDIHVLASLLFGALEAGSIVVLRQGPVCEVEPALLIKGADEAWRARLADDSATSVADKAQEARVAACMRAKVVKDARKYTR